jgi:predicted nucleic acid-binding protein
MPPEAKPPVAYCETNWIVALAFPHHQHHRRARLLREQAATGECDVRLPYAALLEARHAIAEEGNRLNAAFAQLRDELGNAVDNGESGFGPIKDSLRSDAMDRYLARSAHAIIEGLLQDRSVRVLRNQEVVCSTMDSIRPVLRFRGKDVVDLYILGAIIADREASNEKDRPAVFFSTNKREFQPRKEDQAKLAHPFYDRYRIVWRGDFDLSPGVRHWQTLFIGEVQQS